MRGFLIVALALAFPLGAHAEKIAIVNARTYTIAAADPIPRATIVIDKGVIVSIGEQAPPPADARIVDAKGRVVTPGLMNAATQLGLAEILGVPETNDYAVSSGPLGAAFDVEYGLNPNSLLVAQARADGLARAMSYPSSTGSAPFAGLGALVRLADGPDILDRPRAAMFVAVGSDGVSKVGGSRAAQWQLIRNALDEARAVAAAPRTLAPRDQLLRRLDIEALQPVLAGKMPLVIATHRESDIRQAIRLGTDYRLNIVILGGAEAWRVADVLAKAKIPVILDPVANLPGSYDQIGARLDNAALLSKAGVLIAFTVPGGGIDLSYNAGSALREGGGLAVANGLSYAEALRAMTVNAARIWGIADRYGTIEPGKDADLVIWDGDPLEPSNAPVTVFVRGREALLATRQTRLRDRYLPANGRSEAR